MGRAKKITGGESNKKIRLARSQEARDSQMVNLAYELAAQRMLDGTASAQEVIHFLKLGTAKEELELEKLQEENKLLKAKTETLQSQKKVEDLYAEAIKAMRSYSGDSSVEDDEDDYE